MNPTTRTLHTAAPLHIRESPNPEAPSRTITGYAILFNTPSVVLYANDTEEAREIIAPEAITRELLDGSDIKMTMFHDRQLILARSNRGAGTLRYDIDERGVSFEFDAPHTADGDKALELVRRGDIAGCSFMFSTRYRDKDFVAHSVTKDTDGRTIITYTVRAITGLYDFTLAADPAYPDTHCEARDLFAALAAERRQAPDPGPTPDPEADQLRRHQIAEMRRAAAASV